MRATCSILQHFLSSHDVEYPPKALKGILQDLALQNQNKWDTWVAKNPQEFVKKRPNNQVNKKSKKK